MSRQAHTCCNCEAFYGQRGQFGLEAVMQRRSGSGAWSAAPTGASGPEPTFVPGAGQVWSRPMSCPWPRIAYGAKRPSPREHGPASDAGRCRHSLLLQHSLPCSPGLRQRRRGPSIRCGPRGRQVSGPVQSSGLESATYFDWTIASLTMLDRIQAQRYALNRKLPCKDVAAKASDSLGRAKSLLQVHSLGIRFPRPLMHNTATLFCPAFMLCLPV